MYYTSLKTQKKMKELRLTVLTGPPHSPDLAHCHFYLFGALLGKEFVEW
jgi:hypothetical protein